MMAGKMTASCQEMLQQKQRMMEEMKAQDAELTQQVATINCALEDKKVGLMTDILTRMLEQRTAMNVPMEKMQAKMMQDMLQHMQMGKESMSQCPMMKDTTGMKGLKGMKGMRGMRGMDKKGSSEKFAPGVAIGYPYGTYELPVAVSCLRGAGRLRVCAYGLPTRDGPVPPGREGGAIRLPSLPERQRDPQRRAGALAPDGAHRLEAGVPGDRSAQVRVQGLWDQI